jgi:hypothetical protein
MNQEKRRTAKDIERRNLPQRESIIAYLSYALDDVSALGGRGSQLLQMTIAAIAEDPVCDDSNCPPQSTLVQ